ncbi:hypothetical protein JCM3770_004190 [Rhodotorula araucariae]
MLSVDKDVPDSTIRVSVPAKEGDDTNAKSVLVRQVEGQIRGHYSGGAVLPCIIGVQIEQTAPFADLVSPVIGVRFHGRSPPRTAHPVVEFDIAFADSHKFSDALKTPFIYKGKPAMLTHAPPVELKNLVELRLELRDLAVPPSAIVQAIQRHAQNHADIRVVAVVQHFGQTASPGAGAPAIPTYSGRTRAYLQLPKLNKDTQNHSKSVLNSALPNKLSIRSVDTPRYI